MPTERPLEQGWQAEERAEARAAPTAAAAPTTGISMARRFVPAGVDPYDTVEGRCAPP
jgi:hypothetical protein